MRWFGALLDFGSRVLPLGGGLAAKIRQTFKYRLHGLAGCNNSSGGISLAASPDTSNSRHASTQRAKQDC